jgi:hypothetical protein
MGGVKRHYRVAGPCARIERVDGRPVAQLVPLPRSRRRWLNRAELTRRLAVARADPGLRHDLARLAGETTDDLGPIDPLDGIAGLRIVWV